MGGAIVTSSKLSQKEETFSPAEYFACKVVRNEYELLKEYLQRKNVEPFNDVQIHDTLQKSYRNAIIEIDLPLEECRNPAVILFKYTQLLTTTEQTDHVTLIQTTSIAREKELMKLQPKKKVEEGYIFFHFFMHYMVSFLKIIDYSKSFGGTEEDSKNEKEAAALLRGSENTTVNNKTNEIDANYPFLQRPNITHTYQSVLLKEAGKYTKYLSCLGCYMFIHTLSRDVVSLRPESYEEEVEQISKEEDPTLLDPANGIPRISLAQLPGEIERIIKETNRTPLVFDCSKSQGVRSFYSYKANLEDISCLTIPFGKSGLKREDVMERCRVRLVTALKTGTTFALYLGGMTIEHADLKTKLCKKDVFPKETFQCAGLKLLQPDYDPKYKYIYRDSDLEQGHAIAREGFQALVITSVDPYKYIELMGDTIPLGYMTPIYVDYNEE